MDYTFILILTAGGFIALVVFLSVMLEKSGGKKKPEGLAPDEFQQAKKKMHPNCSREDLAEFSAFLRKYQGGFFKVRAGEVIYRDYTGQEKGALKGIFYNVVFPNPNIPVEEKETFRMLIVSKGVNGLNARPDYETRDSRLRNTNEDADDFERKEVGNKGEETVRMRLNRLRDLGYLVINGPVLEANGQRVEYDHIVIGNNGVFSLETKAFGSSKDGNDKASLFIDPGDKWILRKNGRNRELQSPTQQICKERDHLKGILHEAKERVEVKPILVLSNRNLFLKNNIHLDYEVVLLNDLENVITSANLNHIMEQEKRLIAQIIDEHRVNG